MSNHDTSLFASRTPSPSQPSDRLSDWLSADGSLTALLEARAGQPLRVVPVFEGYQPLSLEQKRQLGYMGQRLNRPMLAWVRRSHLYGNDEQPWVAAQSVFPLISLKAEAKRLRHLGSTPIGYVLFKRQPQLPSQRDIRLTPQGWQRQTCYDWYGRRLLIAETFLPAFVSGLDAELEPAGETEFEPVLQTLMQADFSI